jgi:hypothetical protein
VAATLLLATVSAVAMALLYRPGYDPTRIYDGTDTRAFAVLIGAALAFVWPSRYLGSDATKVARWGIDGVGAGGLAVVAVLVWRTSEYSAFLYRGGMVLLSVGTALMVASAASPASRFGRVLGWQPLRWLGVRSYGIYLWHYPIIVLTTPAHGQDSLARGTLQVTAAVVAAALSWRFIEEPVRRGAISRWWAQARSTGWRLGTGGRQTRVAAVAAVLVVALASCGLTGVVRPSPSPAVGTQPPPSATSAASRLPADTATSRPPPSPAAASGPARTACRAVVHIGDSTSDGLVSPAYLPNPRRRIPAQYAGGRDQGDPGDLRCPVDRRNPRQPAQRLHRRAAADTRRIPGLLGTGPGYQRHRRRLRRLAGQPGRPDPADDVGDRQTAGYVGQRQVAARHRAIRGAQHAAVES